MPCEFQYQQSDESNEIQYHCFSFAKIGDYLTRDSPPIVIGCKVKNSNDITRIYSGSTWQNKPDYVEWTVIQEYGKNLISFGQNYQSIFKGYEVKTAELKSQALLK